LVGQVGARSTPWLRRSRIRLARSSDSPTRASRAARSPAVEPGVPHLWDRRHLDAHDSQRIGHLVDPGPVQLSQLARARSRHALPAPHASRSRSAARTEHG
jgi:hypothetical protein